MNVAALRMRAIPIAPVRRNRPEYTRRPDGASREAVYQQTAWRTSASTRMQTSIRFRLTAWYVATLALTLIAIGAATYLLTRSGLYHWLDETLEERAEALSHEVRLVEGRPSFASPEETRGAYEDEDNGFI